MCLSLLENLLAIEIHENITMKYSSIARCFYMNASHSVAYIDEMYRPLMIPMVNNIVSRAGQIISLLIFLRIFIMFLLQYFSAMEPVTINSRFTDSDRDFLFFAYFLLKNSF